MTPEELNRTVEFIVESQARLAAAQEQDRQDRVEFQQWSKGISDQVASSFEKVTHLIQHQSERMDRLDKIYADWTKQSRDFQERVLEFQRESIELQRQAHHLLNLILDRLPPQDRA
jgi:hypothetical protein